MLSRPEHIQSFPTLTSIRPPRAAAVLAWIIGIGICLAVLVLLYVPWVQTSAGTGRCQKALERDPGSACNGDPFASSARCG